MPTLNPGRELDELIAEKVMGYKLTIKQWGILLAEVYEFNGNEIVALPKFSTDISAAWEVVEKFWAMQLFKYDCAKGNWYCAFHVHGNLKLYESYGETAPHSICLAALKAVGG